MQLKFLCETLKFGTFVLSEGSRCWSLIDLILHAESRFRGSKAQRLGIGIRYGIGHDGPGSWHHHTTPKALYTISQINSRGPPSKTYFTA